MKALILAALLSDLPLSPCLWPPVRACTCTTSDNSPCYAVVPPIGPVHVRVWGRRGTATLKCLTDFGDGWVLDP